MSGSERFLLSSECSRVADLMNASENVQRIEFYETKYDNKSAELNCRIFAMDPLDKADLAALAVELNAAIAPVKKALAARLQEQARGIMANKSE